MTPKVNSAVRTIMVAAGSVGVYRGWWDEASMEVMINHLIAVGGALLVVGGAVWGVWAKHTASKEARAIARQVADLQRDAMLTDLRTPR